MVREHQRPYSNDNWDIPMGIFQLVIRNLM